MCTPISSSSSSMTYFQSPGVPIEPGGDVIATFTTDVGSRIINLHAEFLQPFLQMEIGDGDLPPGGGNDNNRTCHIHNVPELLQGRLVEQVIMIDADAFLYI